ncbi:MAG: hypothetical protein UU72_C0001G0066 [candidate division WWE3 bacterium GW2011_GWB1_41_6]|uniref:Uncharacterized protein n=2 Tax=Katanobacteria TaxID=422282 RepID=A0A1F4VKU4_UNCKA|nr:MAG: hypothetical protein UU72_C0001G0066 [candidate division WWE3 bacterium GW2011_GWB1_41_6]OGC57705.1 MAG: hypothetical protein A2976_02075 [candidate division WWE3 bacterium RIFCSPLOWO2_01_FULL_41_9]
MTDVYAILDNPEVAQCVHSDTSTVNGRELPASTIRKAAEFRADILPRNQFKIWDNKSMKVLATVNAETSTHYQVLVAFCRAWVRNGPGKPLDYNGPRLILVT